LFDVGIAVNQFCLQAADLGLGTCIMGWFDERKVKKILGIGNRRVPLLISVGYPDSPTRKKIRKSLDEMSSWNEY
jgi:nitroreductase